MTTPKEVFLHKPVEWLLWALNGGITVTAFLGYFETGIAILAGLITLIWGWYRMQVAKTEKEIKQLQLERLREK